MTDLPSVPGWYGKLPTLGDFASRRLDAAFIDPWDAWLAEGLAAQRDALGEASWLEAYLASPVWRFVLMPGVLPPAGPGPDGAGPTGPGPGATRPSPALAGVLMPSVDRVGRYFPLTLAAPLPALPGTVAELEALQSWLHRLDDAAADALHDDWSVDRLEAELARLATPSSTAGPRPMSAATAAFESVLQGHAALAPLPLPTRADLTAWLAHHSQVPWQVATHGLAFWWAESTEGAPRGLVSRGLPRGEGFAALLGGVAA